MTLGTPLGSSDEAFLDWALDNNLITTNTPSTIKGRWASKLRLSDLVTQRFRLELLFGPISLQSKQVLDIGAGEGLYSAYAAHRGADRVVALEPEVEGSSSNMFESLTEVAEDYPAVQPEQATIEEYDYVVGEFDVIISHNSRVS